jgi:hypothetical protein
LRFSLARATNFSSVSNASSSGKVNWVDAVLVLAGDGDADAVGDGLAEDTVVFELFVAGAQLVSKQMKKAKNKNR